MIKSMDLIYPPLTDQNKFGSIIEELFKQMKNSSLELNKSEDLFQSLLQRAFKGELFAEQREKEGQFYLF